MVWIYQQNGHGFKASKTQVLLLNCGASLSYQCLIIPYLKDQGRWSWHLTIGNKIANRVEAEISHSHTLQMRPSYFREIVNML